MSGWARAPLILSLMLPGCFLDRTPLAGDRDASVGCGECPSGQECVAGECRANVIDADGDGVPAGDDCDDQDPALLGDAERACPGDCGSGIEQCLDGVWGACSAPTDCECTPGDGRNVRCVMCGEQMQRCGADGRWADEGACMGVGDCVADAEDVETRDCGLCGEGTEARTRTCSGECTWSEWSEWGECMDATGICPAGESETETRTCGDCGIQTRTRTCNATCGWDDWSEWSDCDETGAVCAPGDPPDAQMEPCPCGGGMRRRTRTCTAMCTWSDWSPWTECSTGECMPGTTETGGPRECGDCGAQTPTRTCDATCNWGEWVPGECRETRCLLTCACSSAVGFTCCPDGSWSAFLGSCDGC